MQDEDGNPLQTFSANGAVNLAALKHYFTDQHHDGRGNVNSNVKTPGQTYLINAVGEYSDSETEDGADGGGAGGTASEGGEAEERYVDSYGVIQNNQNGAHTFIVYQREEGTGALTVAFTTGFNNPTQLSTGDSVEIQTLDDDTIQWRLGNQAITIGDETVAIDDNYTYKVYEANNICLAELFCENASDIADYGIHFLQGDHAALYFYNWLSPGDAASDFLANFYYGVLTPHENLPESTILSYSIDHAAGAYMRHRLLGTGEDTTLVSDVRRLLHGSGELQANFYSRQLLLNLDIQDHEGNDFLDVRDVELEMTGNQFRLCDTCGGQLDYADATISDVDVAGDNLGLDIDGAFFGPNMDEVAGGIDYSEIFGLDRAPINGIEIGFIGQRQPETPPAPGDTSLPAEVITQAGVTITTYVAELSITSVPGLLTVTATVGTNINYDALQHYYTNLHNDGRGGVNSDVSTTGQEYLLQDEFVDVDSTNYYEILRNNLDGTRSILSYGMANNGTAIVGVIENFDRPISAGNSVEMELAGDSAITWEVEDDAIVVNSNRIELTEGYTYNMYSQPNHCQAALCQDDGATVRFDAHFLQAEYAALHFGYTHRTTIVAGFSADRYYGVQTPHANMPSTGEVSYSIDHAIGAYTSGSGFTDKVLHGTGELDADFSNSRLTLNLDMNDHDGNNFLDINDLQLEVSGNQFHLCSTCSGQFDFDADAGIADIANVSSDVPASNYLDVGGGFYGPNAEEVAGSISYEIYEEESADVFILENELDINFIGQRE